MKNWTEFEKGMEIGLVKIPSFAPNKPEILIGTITKKGKNALIVDEHITFKDGKVIGSDIFGSIYHLFLNIDDATEYQTTKDKESELRFYISNQIQSLSIEKLEKIVDIIKTK